MQVYFSAQLYCSHIYYIAVLQLCCAVTLNLTIITTHNDRRFLVLLISYSLIYFSSQYWDIAFIVQDFKKKLCFYPNLFFSLLKKLPSLTNNSRQCSIHIRYENFPNITNIKILTICIIISDLFVKSAKINYFDRTLTRQTSSIYSV